MPHSSERVSGMPAGGVRAALASRARVPVTGPFVGRLQARQLAQHELARSIYRPSVWSRLWSDVMGWLTSLVNHSAAGWLALTLLVLGVLIVLAAVLYHAGPARLNRRSSVPVLAGRPRSAAEHRSAADSLAAAGDYRAAVIERVRGIAVDLESRQILSARPGRTAAELGAEAGLAIPAEAAALASAARLFDDVRYGGRPGSQLGYEQVADLDMRLRAARIEAAAR